MRRRRPSKERTESTREPARRRAKASGQGGRWLRLSLGAIAAILVGGGGGYLYATHLLFPPPEEVIQDLRSVPDLLGMEREEAEQLLRSLGLEVGPVAPINHPTTESGSVLGQSPLPGQLAPAGSAIELTVSLGPERRPVPEVARLRADRAVTVLTNTGFTVVVDSIPNPLPLGSVVSLTPPPGSELVIPSQVRLTLSLGPPLFPMPYLEGMHIDEVVPLLDSLGLLLGEVESRFRFGFSQGRVLEAHPPADSLVPAGTSVHLVIGSQGLF